MHHLALDMYLSSLGMLGTNRTNFLRNNRYFEIQTSINVNSVKRYLVRFIQLSSAIM